jgi:hypothetical protein
MFEWLAIKKYFFYRSNNIPVYSRNNAGYMAFRKLPKFTPRGIPDIVIVREGKYIGVECKRPGAALRPEQADFGTNLVLNGGFYYVVHSLEELQAIPQLL